jgi:Zn-dependent protease
MPETPGRTSTGSASSHRRWSVRVGRVLGIDVRIHATFALIVLLFALGSSAEEGPGLVVGMAWLATIFACVLVHELAHCVVGRRRGAVVHEIVLLPIGGVSKLERLPQDPKDEFAMAIAGPLASLGLGIVAMAAAVLLGQALLPIEILTGPALAGLAWFNLIVGTFNLLPAFPLDGGRVLRARLERTRDLETATRLAARIGRTLALALVAAGVVFDPWLLIIGVFVYFGASAEEAATVVHVRLAGLQVGDVMRRSTLGIDRDAPTLTPETPVDPDAVRLLSQTPGGVAAVVRDGTAVGSLRLEDVASFAVRREVEPHAVP